MERARWREGDRDGERYRAGGESRDRILRLARQQCRNKNGEKQKNLDFVGILWFDIFILNCKWGMLLCFQCLEPLDARFVWSSTADTHFMWLYGFKLIN